MNLIALMGKLQSGKDTIGQMIREELPGKAVTLAFADKLKEVCMDLYGLSYDDVYTEEGKARATPFQCLKCPSCGSIDVKKHNDVHTECRACGALGEAPGFQTFWTNRMILQHIGTEGCRKIDPNVWVNFGLRQAAKHLEGHGTPQMNVVVITDCRFRSEADAVWRAGGEVWRIRRPSTDLSTQGLVGHQSETEMDTLPDSVFQNVISNDGTLEQLRHKVNQALVRFHEVRLVR